MIPVALSIGGSDPSGGAGIQADLKTFHTHRVYGTTAITLLTVQSTTEVRRVEVLAAELVRAQIEVVAADLPPDAVKTGALGSAAIALVVADLASKFAFKLIVDPVLASTQGSMPLGDREALRRLLPRAALVTPNAHEASVISGVSVHDRESAAEAARAIADLGAAAVLVKGGHLTGDEAIDVLFEGGSIHELAAPRIDTRHTHGTGCALSAAICARVARGEPMLEAVTRAKEWLTQAIAGAPGLGHGRGPLDHFAKPR